MIPLVATFVMHLPLSRKDARFPEQGDRGNAILLDARECLKPKTLSDYQAAGLLHEGIRIGAYDEALFSLLDQMRLTWCPWPEEGFTLAIMAHSKMGVLADRMIVLGLMCREKTDDTN